MPALVLRQLHTRHVGPVDHDLAEAATRTAFAQLFDPIHPEDKTP